MTGDQLTTVSLPDPLRSAAMDLLLSDGNSTVVGTIQWGRK
jgi:hypothetical protein